jgi:hypothetical protein
MRAVFAGVQHGERPIRQRLDPGRAGRAGELRRQLAKLDLARKYVGVSDGVSDRRAHNNSRGN